MHFVFWTFLIWSTARDTCVSKNQWKSSNGQHQCFCKGMSRALCWKRQKTPKLEKLKRKLLNFLKMYDLYRVVPWESQRPGNSENVVVFEFSRFQTIAIGRQSWVKIEEKIPRRGTVTKKKTRPRFLVLGSEIESACDQHGCSYADSISSRNSQNCGRVFFLLRLIVIVTLSLFQPCVDFERW